MPAKRGLTMRHLRQMLRLHHDGVSDREVGRRLGVARSTVQDNLERARKAGLAWPLAPDLTDDVLEQRLFAKAGYRPGVRRRVEPDWTTLVREMKRPGVNLQVLWEEYRDVHPKGYGYTATTLLANSYVLIGEPSADGLDDPLVLHWLAMGDLGRAEVEIIDIEDQ